MEEQSRLILNINLRFPCAHMCMHVYMHKHMHMSAHTHILKHVYTLTHMKMEKQKQNKSNQQRTFHYFVLLAEISVPGLQKVRRMCGRGHQDYDNWCLF